LLRRRVMQTDDRRRRRTTPSKRTPKARHRALAGKARPSKGSLAGVASMLNPLDLDRAASMADEGGRAAAEVEREGVDASLVPAPLAPTTPSRAIRRIPSLSFPLALAGLLVLAIAALRWRR
jgi:hypothetical protein